MIAAILRHFGYVKMSETVSVADYMRLRDRASEQLDAYEKFRKTVQDNLFDSITETPAHGLPRIPASVINFQEWKNRK